MRSSLAFVWFIASLLIVPARAAQATASICAITFNDLNGNKTRDPGESTLLNVNVSLLISVNSTNAIIANHVMNASESQYCFGNLAPGNYTLAFNSPLINLSTEDTFTVSVKSGEMQSREFGGTPREQPAPPPAGLVIPLTRQVRIGLAVGGALLVMLLMIGLGFILRGFYGLIARR